MCVWGGDSKCSVAIPHSAVGLSAVCDCGIRLLHTISLVGLQCVIVVFGPSIPCRWLGLQCVIVVFGSSTHCLGLVCSV